MWGCVIWRCTIKVTFRFSCSFFCKVLRFLREYSHISDNLAGFIFYHERLRVWFGRIFQDISGVFDLFMDFQILSKTCWNTRYLALLCSEKVSKNSLNRLNIWSPELDIDVTLPTSDYYFLKHRVVFMSSLIFGNEYSLLGHVPCDNTSDIM